MIDRQSPVPVYYQIKQYIEGLIRNKNLKSGDKIPSEREFTEKFHVSRMTIRQAVMELVNSGVLIRKKGKGTFVSDQRKIEKALNQLNGFTEDMLNRGLNPGSKLLGFDLISVGIEIGHKLQLSESEQVYQIRRTRYADQRPMAIETTYIPEKIVPGLTSSEADTSLYDYVEKSRGLKIDHAEQSLEAALVTAEEAHLLDVPEGSPILVIERISFLKNGTAFEFTRSLYRADRYKFIVQLTKST